MGNMLPYVVNIDCSAKVYLVFLFSLAVLVS